MNNTIVSMAATFVIAANAGFFEKLPNTYPMMNTIHATNSIRVKMIIAKTMVLNFNSY